MSLRRPVDLDALAWDRDGLVPVVVQEVASGAVLMVAWADRQAVGRTVERGEGWFWSRSRQRLWRKGESSGNVLAVREVAVDCDGDTLLYRVDPEGPTCHSGARSCFEDEDGRSAPRLELGWLWDVVVERGDADPGDSYTARLLAAGIDRVARKVGEESTEVIIAALRAVAPVPGRPDLPPPVASPLAAESADLLYHLLVLLLAAGVTPEEVAGELRRRHRDGTAGPTPKPEGPATPEAPR